MNELPMDVSLFAAGIAFAVYLILRIIRDLPELVRRFKGWKNGNGGGSAQKRTLELLEQIAANTASLKGTEAKVTDLHEWMDPGSGHRTWRERREREQADIREWIRGRA